MTPLHRHQIARVTSAGWETVLQLKWDKTARACISHWAAHSLPLVVTRQKTGDIQAQGTIAFGLPAPQRWDRRRLVINIARHQIIYFDEFPSGEKLTQLLPRAAREAWLRLCGGLKRQHIVVRVYGSYGWQQISGLDHVHKASDVDVWVSVSSREQADIASEILQNFDCPSLTLDGELVFNGDCAVNWREWLAWRGGRAKAILVKTCTGSMLANSFQASGPHCLVESVS